MPVGPRVLGGQWPIGAQSDLPNRFVSEITVYHSNPSGSLRSKCGKPDALTQRVLVLFRNAPKAIRQIALKGKVCVGLLKDSISGCLLHSHNRSAKKYRPLSVTLGVEAIRRIAL